MVNEFITLENPVDQVEIRRTKISMIVILTFGVFVCAFYSSIVPIFIAFAVIGLIWLGEWYTMVYTNPKFVFVGEMGITMEFRYGKARLFVPWQEIREVWISHKPNTVAEASIRFKKMKTVFVTKEIGTTVYEKYTKVMGRAPPEW